MEIKQSVFLRNQQGMAVDFRFSRIVTLRALSGAAKNTLLYRLFDNLKEGKPFHKLSLGLIEETLQKRDANVKPHRVLKAVVVSPEYWEEIFAAATAPLDKSVVLSNLTDDFLVEGDRLTRAITGTSPMQERVSNIYTIADVSGDGQVDLGVPFVGTSLSVIGATPTSDFPTTGLIGFDSADIGAEVSITYVTAPLHTVIAIQRVAKNPTGASNIGSGPQAYIMSPALATLLGVPLPTL